MNAMNGSRPKSLPMIARSILVAGVICSWAILRPQGVDCAAQPSPPAGAQAEQDAGVEKYFEQKASVDAATGERHRTIGDWCVNKGLLEQAREQFALAISRGRGQARDKATAALTALERLTPDQIKKRFHPPSGKELKLYRLRVAKAALEDRRGLKELADSAWSAGESLADVAAAGYGRLIDTAPDIPEFDAEGRIVLDVGTVPEPISKTVCDGGGAITINGRLRVRCAFLRRIPSVDAIYMAESEDLAFFSEESLDEAIGLHEVGAALLPHLKNDLGAEPDRVLNVCVFHEAESYDEYCAQSGHQEYTASNGFTNLEDFLSVVRVPDRNGRALTDFQVQSIVLHELVHLFQFAITATPMPSWYAEGLAETYGGVSTYEWDGRAKRLRVKGLIERRRIDSLRAAGNMIGLEEFLDLEARNLHSLDRAKTERFYTQAWAFLRFLRVGAGRTAAKKLAAWEALCRQNRLDSAAARSRFRLAFGKNMKSLEKDFVVFLKKL